MEDSNLLCNPRRSPVPPTSAPRYDYENFQAKSPPNQTRSGDWRPASLTRPALLSVLALSLLLFATIEALAQRSQSNGGLVSYSSIDEIPGPVSFAYRYLPTIVATLFSLLWNWIDLDVKRVHPWIELSKPTGATAGDSILLDYSSHFLAFIPFRAAKRRHWPVFFSGTAAVLILWVLTPLQTALFGNSNVLRTKPATVISKSHLTPSSEQIQTTQYLQLSYAIGSRNQSYPTFTTKDYALFPFYVEDNVTDSMASTNWTSETTKLWADIDCQPIEAKYMGHQEFQNRSAVYNFTGSDNCYCDYDFLFTKYSPYPAMKFRDNSQSNMWVDNDWKCDVDAPYSMLIFWANPKDPSGNHTTEFDITAFQCYMSYFKQQVTATVDSKTLLPFYNATQPLSDREKLESTEYNDTTFKWSLPMANTYSVWRMTSNYTDSIYPDVLQNDDAWPGLDDIFRYATLGRDTPIESYSDPSLFKGLFEDTLQQFFSLSAANRLTNQTTSFNETATVTTRLTTIVVSRLFAIASEVLILLGAVGLCLLCYFMRPSACALDRIPSSIRGFVDIAHDSSEIRQLLKPMDTASEEHMEHALGGAKLQLTNNISSNRNEFSIIQGSTASSDKANETSPKSYYEPVKPWILRRVTGAGLVALLIAGVVVLSYFKTVERKHNGLKRPSQNFDVLQLLENYIPTAFSTSIEPFWILLARTMCIFQPFKDLWKGRAPAATTIEATYTAVPPQLALFKTITARKIILSLLCFAALLANALAVGLSALFTEKPTEVTYSHQFQSLYQPQLNTSMLDLVNSLKFRRQDDPLFMTLTNMTYGTKLFPWTSTEYYFQPMNITRAEEMSSNDEFTVRTRGYGADVNCTSYPSSTHRLWDYNDISDPDAATREAVRASSCIGLVDSVVSEMIDARTTGSPSPPSGASTITGGLARYGYNVTTMKCAPDFALGWGRAPDGVQDNNTIWTSFAQCRPTFQTAMFDTTVDRDGFVLRYKRVGEIESTLDYSNSTNNINLFLALTTSLLPMSPGEWSNNTNSQTWLDQFMYLQTGSRDSFDPEKPVPDPEELIPSIRKIYRRMPAAYMGGFPEFLLDAKETTQVTGTRRTEETRIFMDETAFIIIMVVLGIDIMIALAFYLPESLYVLPRLPSSAGAILAYIVPSRAVRDGTPPEGWKDQTFSFGRYMGYDGKSYVGVEMDAYVVEKDTSLGAYKPLLPPSFTENLLGRTSSSRRDDQSQSS